jgi:hypothetical protein
MALLNHTDRRIERYCYRAAAVSDAIRIQDKYPYQFPTAWIALEKFRLALMAPLILL